MSELGIRTKIDEKEIDTAKISIKKKIKIKKLSKIKDIRLVSIDIGSKYIKILEAKKKKNVISITSALKIESPSDIVEKGELKNLPSVINAINNAFTKWRISTKDISFTSVAGSVMSREISIIDSDEITQNERKALAENELRQYLPINLLDYQIQFTEVGRFEESGVKKLKVLVMVYPIKLIKSYLTIITDMGNKRRPCSLDVTNNSLQKFFKHIKTINGKPVDKEKIHLFIDMGKSTFNTSIIADEKLQFMRIIEASQDAIDRGIALRIGKAYDDAEQMKMDMCNLMDKDIKNQEKVKINEITRGYVNTWIDELVRITHFYSNKEARRIDKIYLYGGGSKLNGLAEYIEEKMGIDTEKIVTFDGIEIAKNINIANIDQFINCIGTVIRF